MKRYSAALLSIAMIVMTSGLTSGTAQAETQNINSLRYETQHLNSMVQYSTMHYAVKSSVANFGNSVESLYSCEYYNPGHYCSYEVNRVRQMWVAVDRNLYGSHLDYPEVHRQYQRVRAEMAYLGGGGGGNPPQGRYFARGRIDQWYFEFNGVSRADIQDQCDYYAYYYNIRWVRHVNVNNRVFNYPSAISSAHACSIIGSHSIRY